MFEDFLVAFHATVSALDKQQTVLKARGGLSKTIEESDAGYSCSLGERIAGWGSGCDDLVCQVQERMLGNDLAGGANALAAFRADTQLAVHITQCASALVEGIANLAVADILANTDFHGSARWYLDTEW
jgi:hypothetical protein